MKSSLPGVTITVSNFGIENNWNAYLQLEIKITMVVY